MVLIAVFKDIMYGKLVDDLAVLPVPKPQIAMLPGFGVEIVRPLPYAAGPDIAIFVFQDIEYIGVTGYLRDTAERFLLSVIDK